jgi:hypothetical protein
VTPGSLEVAFDAMGAADAGSRGRVVAVVDVVDAATSAEAALTEGAVGVLGAAPAGMEVPVAVKPAATAALAATLAKEHQTDVVIVAEPRIASNEERLQRAAPVTGVLAAENVGFEVVPNQGAGLPGLVKLAGRVVIVISAAGGVAFDAALTAGAPAVSFATTARIVGMTGWEVTRMGAQRAIELAKGNGSGLTVVAASSNATDDFLAAFEIARAVIAEGFLRL